MLRVWGASPNKINDAARLGRFPKKILLRVWGASPKII